ncbi:hypothetical protein D3C77_452640 [compost metagenome]
MTAEHIFSHIHWYLRVFRFQEAAALSVLAGFAEMAVAEQQEAYHEGERAEEYRWITAEDMNDLAFPNVFIKILRQYFAEQKVE